MSGPVPGEMVAEPGTLCNLPPSSSGTPFLRAAQGGLHSSVG